MRRTVLILCTGNSCRSQMAEGLVTALLGEWWRALSAGTAPTQVHPLAIAVMQELGIDISGHTSKHLDVYRDLAVDLVITVCSHAEQACPIWLGSAPRIHLPFDDPAQAQGSDEDILAVFRRVRDEMRQALPPLLERWEESSR